MCVVSMVGDHFQDKWTEPNSPFNQLNFDRVSRAEFLTLKKEVEDLKKLLIKAKEYDIKNNEPNCEMEDKIKILKEIAAKFGVDLSDVFKD